MQNQPEIVASTKKICVYVTTLLIIYQHAESALVCINFLSSEVNEALLLQSVFQ